MARVGVTRHGIPPQDCNTLSDVGTVVAPTDFYAARGRAGIQQGPPFTALTRIVRTPGETVHAEIVLPEEAGSTQGYGIHPVMLEAALQSLVAATPVEPLPVEVTYLPMSLGSIRLSGVMGRRARCRAESVSANDDGADLWGHVSVIDDAGTAIAEVRDVRLRRVERSMVPSTLDRATGDDAHRSGPSSDWSSMTAEEVCAELQAGLQAILARELQAPQTTLDINQPFPEMGLDSMMAMAVLREAQHLVGIDLSATMLWDHPTISSLARHLAESLAPELNTEHDDVDLDGSTSSSVLDALFDSVESEHFPSESGIR
ncbi:polyketide synthase dehydratase domain-containing protein [Mycolicibacterium agri]|uniref:polyketide synthase dehydratase domain-containing protein n=1 Tax=Mycolicibacterium agri TaxID=36811 RepID=UPI0030769479